MIVNLIFVLIMFGYGMVDCRGPHHPRGTPVAKHVHYRPTKNNSPEKITEDVQLLHDKEHLQEHLDNVIEEPDLSKMTDEELEFYYFQVHDTDKNSKLDGLEILQAIYHTVHGYDKAQDEEQELQEATNSEFEYYVELIDRVLKEDDANNDGYLSYPEYAETRKKAVLAEKRDKPYVNIV